MVNREWQTVSVVTFTTGTDAYGQKRQKGSTLRDIKMVVKIYNQRNVADVRYNEVEVIGLCEDKTLTDSNQIKIGNDYYQILYIIPSGRLYQVLMKKEKK